ncbi:hypothetical protein LJC13_00335 [Peptostreptococcaceae bacterium OttesenSCG-928-C18]|nr:hypothetical protein [Peptostreptococcaceae bacterium OttesenSCG-928-C18]
MAKLSPYYAHNNFKFGCRTGLQLDEIFKINLNIIITDVDLIKAMLDKLKGNYLDEKGL